MANKETKTETLEVAKISQAEWNPNEMSEEKFEALKADLKEHGQLYPIVVREVKGPKQNGYEVVEGNHRLKAAKALCWKAIKATVQEFKTPEEAMLLNFRANSARGQHNPFKEAELFKRILEAGRTQESLGKELGVDRSLIAKRVSLLKIDSDVRKDIQKAVPHITVSCLEMISPCSVGVQRLVAYNLLHQREGNDEITVKELREVIAHYTKPERKTVKSGSAKDTSDYSSPAPLVEIQLHQDCSKNFPYCVSHKIGPPGYEGGSSPCTDIGDVYKSLGRLIESSCHEHKTIRIQIRNSIKNQSLHGKGWNDKGDTKLAAKWKKKAVKARQATAKSKSVKKHATKAVAKVKK